MAKINKLELNDHIVYQMISGDLEILVCPDDGMNIQGIGYGETRVIEIDPIRYANKALYGVPILYPTPNRVKDNRFIYDDKIFSAQMHGIVKKESFKIVEINESHDEVYIIGRLVFEKGTKIYEAFPFSSQLDIKITVSNDTVTYEYRIENQGTKELPYGFAIHPFFQNPGRAVRIETKAKKVMEMTEEKIPTGVCPDTLNTEFDLSKSKLVSELSLDHVYTDLENPIAKIHYPEFTVDLNATKDFSHLVVFTPPGQSFFCIENQTCSTNAHNLYNDGFREESGLLTIKPGEGKSGKIDFKFSRPL